MKQADTAGALADFERSLHIRATLVAKDAENLEAKRDLAIGLANVGRAREIRGDIPGAMAVWSQGLSLLEHLKRVDPTNTQIQSDLATCRFRIARIRIGQDDSACSATG